MAVQGILYTWQLISWCWTIFCRFAVYLPMFSFCFDSAGTRFPKVHYLIAFMMIFWKSGYLKDRYSSLERDCIL